VHDVPQELVGKAIAQNIDCILLRQSQERLPIFLSITRAHPEPRIEPEKPAPVAESNTHLLKELKYLKEKAKEPHLIV
jgi:hypothetical protein